MTPILVPQEHVDTYFPVVAKYLEKAVKHNRCSGWEMPRLYQACAMREAYLMIDDAEDPKNAATFKFEIIGGIPTCTVMFLGGEGGCDWVDGLKVIKEFAAQLGVHRMMAHMRDAWLRHPGIKTKRLATLCEIEV